MEANSVRHSIILNGNLKDPTVIATTSALPMAVIDNLQVSES
jgi:hypothetical protein